jgi:hypothetical protein
MGSVIGRQQSENRKRETEEKGERIRGRHVMQGRCSMCGQETQRESKKTISPEKKEVVVTWRLG